MYRQEDIITKGDCCFNHIIGLPTKDDIEKPMFDYQEELFDSLFDSSSDDSFSSRIKNKHLWVKKATGLGITELVLRIMLWLCLKDDSFQSDKQKHKNPPFCKEVDC